MQVNSNNPFGTWSYFLLQIINIYGKIFIVTIAMAVSAHNILHLPPVVGMMTGLGFLKLFGYYLQRRDQAAGVHQEMVKGSPLGIKAMHQGDAEQTAEET